MNRCLVRVKKLDPAAKLPHYGTECAAGADLYACTFSDVTIAPGECKVIHTGIAVELPEGCVGLIYARSGLATKKGLAPANKVGVIDSDYRGEVCVALYNHSSETQTVQAYDRVAQLVIAPYYLGVFEETGELSDTIRGQGGFGSTGK